MELLPMVKHDVTKATEDDLMLAELYEAAGMEAMAMDIRERSMLSLCKVNNLEVLRGGKVFDDDARYGRFYYAISDYEGLDWEVEKIQSSMENVPIELLKKISQINEKDRLRIGVPIRKHVAITDPILLYELPYMGDRFIEIARWK